MPLTEAEQKELDELKSRRAGLTGTIQQPVITGLAPGEQQELQQLKQNRAEIIKQDQERQQKIGQLLGSLGGRLPTTGELPSFVRPFGGTFGGAAIGSQQLRQREIQRRGAFQELSNMGFKPEQLKLSMQTQKVLGGARVGRTAGGIGGALAATAIAGRVIPGPIDDAVIMGLLIAAGGAGVGGVAGEAAQTAIEEKRLIGKREALKAFAIEAGTEAGARGVVLGGKAILSPLIKKIVPEAAALVEDFAKVGGHFSPTELDQRFTIRIAEAFSRGSFGAKEIFQEFEEKQGRAVLAYADNIIEAIGEGVARQTPEEIGELFAKGITRPNGRVFNLLDDLFKPLYSQVDDLSKGSTFNISKLKSFAKQQLVKDKALLKEGVKRHGVLLTPSGREAMETVIDLKTDLTATQLRDFNSKILKDVRKFKRDADQSEGLIKKISQITRDILEDPTQSKNFPTKARNLLNNTNRLFATSRKGIETTFSETLTKRLLKNPSRVVREVFPNNNPKAIRLLRKSLLEPISGKPSTEGKVLFNQLRQAWLADAVDQATKEGIAKPKVFNNVLRKLGNKSLKEMFPEKEIANNVKKIQTIFEIAGKTPPSGASLFSRGAQVGGFIMMYNSGKEGDAIGFTAGAALAIGPLAFAKLATNPKGVKFLTAGFKMKPGASGIVPNAVRMIRLLREMNQKENKQKLAALKLEQRRLRQLRATPPRASARELGGFGGRGF